MWRSLTLRPGLWGSLSRVSLLLLSPVAAEGEGTGAAVVVAPKSQQVQGWVQVQVQAQMQGRPRPRPQPRLQVPWRMCRARTPLGHTPAVR